MKNTPQRSYVSKLFRSQGYGACQYAKKIPGHSCFIMKNFTFMRAGFSNSIYYPWDKFIAPKRKICCSWYWFRKFLLAFFSDFSDFILLTCFILLLLNFLKIHLVVLIFIKVTRFSSEAIVKVSTLASFFKDFFLRSKSYSTKWKIHQNRSLRWT